MHSTPNYGYTCNTPDPNDRDIERLKDKADNHSERITRNEERIKCLSGRVQSLEYAPCGKEAPDCKPDSCGKALRRHLTDPGVHEELFEQKVDKKDGCRLICEDELQMIYDALEDRYTREETDTLLDEKADKNVVWYNLPLAEGAYSDDRAPCRYTKIGNVVYVAGWIRGIEILSEIFTLPEGFRPPYQVEKIVAQTSKIGETNQLSRVTIRPDGTAYWGFSTRVEGWNGENGISVDFQFVSMQ